MSRTFISSLNNLDDSTLSVIVQIAVLCLLLGVLGSIAIVCFPIALPGTFLLKVFGAKEVSFWSVWAMLICLIGGFIVGIPSRAYR